MIPIVNIPSTVQQELSRYRSIFSKDAGFDHIARYITGLLISPNKTLQGIYDNLYWERNKPSRRAMHDAIFQSGWDSEKLMKLHRKLVSTSHSGDKGPEIITLDWTLSHHDKGPCIYGVKKGFDYVDGRYCRFQTVITATIANKNLIDGIEAVVQRPAYIKEEEIYLKNTVEENYQDMEKAQDRILDLLHYKIHKISYKKRTEIVLDIVKQLESENQFPSSNYAFDNGVLTLPLTKFIESCGKHWVSEIETNRNIMWNGQWSRVDDVAKQLRKNHPETFRTTKVTCKNGKQKKYWAFTKVVRLKRYGRKRLLICHEREDLTDLPKFLLTDALQWDKVKILQTWSYRWTVEVFHEFAKQDVGFENAQVRNEKAVKRHFRLSCVAQSILQRTFAAPAKSEKFEFAKGKITIGQRQKAIVREAFYSFLKKVKQFFNEGKSIDYILEDMMPA